MDTVKAYQRHDITDELWCKIAPFFPNGTGKRGRPAGDNRRFFNAVAWIMRSGAPWRDLPPDYGNWNSIFVRFRRLAKAGFWEKLASNFSDCPDLEWVMLDASHIKVHQHGMGAPGGTEDAGRTKEGINTKIHVAVDSHGMPIRFLITAGNQADCTQGIPLLENLVLQYVLADKGYDSDAIVEYVLSQNAIPVIPPRSNRKVQRDYDKYLYKLRHLVENYFQKAKRWRGLATRYVKTTLSFSSYFHIFNTLMWAKVV